MSSPTLETLSRKLDELRTIVDCQSDLIGHLIAQSVTTTARLETILSTQREILEKHGIDRARAQEICQTIFASCLAIAQKESTEALARADKTRPPSGSGRDTQKN